MIKQKRLYWNNQNGFLQQVSVRKAFPFLTEKHHMISLVGAGGKTTTMYALAEEASDQGYHTLVTTTTHIRIPDQEHVMAENVDKLKEIWENGGYGVMGTVGSGEKLTKLPEDEFYRVVQMSECVLIEADGAKCFPCKVPAVHEPVLVPECDVIIGVMGLDAVGQTLRQSCFRLEEAKHLLQVTEEHMICEEDLCRILTSEQGTRKDIRDREYYIVLNKCDNEQRRESAEYLAALLQEKGMEHVIISGNITENL